MEKIVKIRTKEDLINSLFCKNLIALNFENRTIRCIQEDCKCTESVDLNNLFELAALIYSVLNNSNLKIYHTHTQYSYVDCQSNLKKVTEEMHKEFKGKYDTFGHCLSVQQSTIDLIKSLLMEAINVDQLVVTLFNILKYIDMHVGIVMLSGMVGRLKRTQFKTKWGLLILNQSPISRYLNELASINSWEMPEGNVDHLGIRNLVNNIILSKENYPHHNVKHITNLDSFNDRLPSGDLGKLTFGFISDKVLTDDYEWEIIENEGEEAKYFYFKDIIKEGFKDRLLSRFQEMLAREANFIILPELLVPIYLQDAIKEELRETGNNTLSLVFSGTFHAFGSEIDPFDTKSANYIYNYSETLFANGISANKVFKCERFIFRKRKVFENSEGVLRNFADHDGIEFTAYDKNFVNIIDTKIGRIAVLICVDFLNPHIEEILVDRSVDLIFVMALTPSPQKGKFLRKMQDLGEMCSSVVVLCNNPMVNPEKSKTFVVYLPGFNEFVSDEIDGILSINSILREIK